MVPSEWSEPEILMVAVVLYHITLLGLVAAKADRDGIMAMIGLSSLLLVAIGPDDLLWQERWGWVLLATGGGALGFTRPGWWKRNGVSPEERGEQLSSPGRIAVSIFSTRAEVGDEVERILYPAETRRSDRWHEFLETVPHSDCSVLIDPWIRAGASLDRIREFQMKFPYHPLILVTARDADGMRMLRTFVVDQIVWDHQLNPELRQAVEQARLHGVMQHLERRVEACTEIPTKLRTVICLACRPGTAAQTVGELAALVDRDRRSLWRWWSQTFGDAAPLSPKDFLDWIVIVRATIRRASGHSWFSVAEALDVHEDTLARIAKRTVGLSLGELEEVGVEVLIPVFLDEMLNLIDYATPNTDGEDLDSEDEFTKGRDSKTTV